MIPAYIVDIFYSQLLQRFMLKRNSQIHFSLHNELVDNVKLTFRTWDLLGSSNYGVMVHTCGWFPSQDLNSAQNEFFRIIDGVGDRRSSTACDFMEVSTVNEDLSIPKTVEITQWN